MISKSFPTASEENSFKTVPFQKVFEAQAALQLLLSPEWNIVGVTDAYLRESMTDRENIMGKNIFDVFPENPEYHDSTATAELRKSLEQVFATGKSHQIESFRYDIPDPGRSGVFMERFWCTTNTPVVDENGNVILIIHETTNISDEVKARKQLNESKEGERQALAQAEQQRMRLERLLEQAPAAFALLEGPEFRYSVLNNAYQQLFPGRELLGLPLFDALPELRNQVVYDIIQNVYNTGETFEGKEVLIPVARYEGQPLEEIYWNFIYQALYDAEGKITGILIFALDVTEFVVARRQVEKTASALQDLNRELEERVEDRTKELRIVQADALNKKQQLENLFMQAPSAICILDGPDHVYQLVNPVYQKIFPGREILGKPLLEALPELEGTTIPEVLKQVYETGETYIAGELPLMLARHEGGPLEQIYWAFTYQARHNGEGKVDGVLVFAHEVTNQVEVRKTIESSAQQLRLVTDSLPVLISYLDKEEKYKFANRAYESWFNMKIEDVLDKTALEVVGVRAYAKAKAYIKQALAGEQVNYETAMPYPGRIRYTNTSFVPDVLDGEVAGFYALISDVTEQVESRMALERREQEAKAMAEKLSKANQRLMQTNNDLDNFIYTASHDLKAPISNIEMLVEELLVELPTESLEQKEVSTIINMIRGAIGRFKKTISSLTEITKLQKDNRDTRATVSIADVVSEVVLDLNKLIEKTGTEIEIAVGECTTASFSEKNLRSIIYNLLSNAIKYRHPAREPKVSVSCEIKQDHLLVQVQDNGLGIGSKQQARLFTMFRRFHDHVEGSGVGLYMVKRIIDNAGGKIEVSSEEGVGSLFRVYIPL